MQNQPLQTKEELLAEAELLNLAIDNAFRRKLLALLTDPNCDPNMLLEYLKMNEKREAQKLKDFTAQLKERQTALNEKLEERKTALEERKQDLNERKFQYETQEMDDEEPAPSPTPIKPVVSVQQPVVKAAVNNVAVNGVPVSKAAMKN